MTRRVWQCAVLTVLAGLATFHFAYTADPQQVGEIIPVEKPVQFDGPQAQPLLLVESSKLICAAEARASFGVDGTGFACAVLDTGLRTTHTDFTGRVVAQRNETTDNGGNVNDASDGQGHGTNVCGIVCANGSHVGIAPGANIIPVKVLDNSGSFADIADGLQWVIDNRIANNITVVNMSLGSNQNLQDDNIDSGGIKAKIQALRAANVAVVVSAGNSFFGFTSVEGMAFPVIIRETVSVGAVYDANIGLVSYQSGAVANTTDADRVTPFTQRLHETTNANTRTDIFAPGAALTSSGISNDNGESTMHGTSQASPVTAGAILLMQQHYFNVNGFLPTVTELENILHNTAATVNDGDDEDDNVTNTGKNFPRLDVYAALEHIGPPASHASSTTSSPDCRSPRGCSQSVRTSKADNS